jgi:hypothetical protein
VVVAQIQDHFHGCLSAKAGGGWLARDHVSWRRADPMFKAIHRSYRRPRLVLLFSSGRRAVPGRGAPPPCW